MNAVYNHNITIASTSNLEIGVKRSTLGRIDNDAGLAVGQRSSCPCSDVVLYCTCAIEPHLARLYSKDNLKHLLPLATCIYTTHVSHQGVLDFELISRGSDDTDRQ